MKKTIEKLNVMNKDINVLEYIDLIELVLDVAEIEEILSDDEIELIVKQLNSDSISDIEIMLVEVFEEYIDEIRLNQANYNSALENPTYENAAYKFKEYLN
jgi:hypothetical protein